MLGLICFGPVYAEPCDPYLLRVVGNMANNPLRYQRRGDRCEGTFWREVGARSIHMVSLATASSGIDPSGGPIRIRWRAPADARSVQLRVCAPTCASPFRMDTECRASQGEYVWPIDIARGMGCANTLAIRGWTEQNVGGLPREVHVPLAFDAHGTSAGDSYVAVLWSALDLEDIRVVVTREGTVTPLHTRDAGTLAALHSFRLAIPRPPTLGYYRVLVAAVVGAAASRGRPVSTEFWFYQP